MPFLATRHAEVPNKDLLSWTFDDLQYEWDRPIYIDALNPTRLITARQAKSLIRKLVAGFRHIGVKPGDCVCLHSFNDICYSIFFLGIIATGGVYTGTNPGYTPSELAHTLRTSKAKWVLVQPNLLEPMMKACEQVGISKDRIIIFNPNSETPPEGFLQWSDLLSYGEQDWVRFDDKKTSQNTTAALCHSSGTTGLPKAAMISHYNYVAYNEAMNDERPWHPRRLIALPMFHATVPVCHTTPLWRGDTTYVLPRFDPEKWFWASEKYEINEMSLVPAIVIVALHSPHNKKYSLKSTRYGFVGAAPLDKAPQAAMEALLGGAYLTQVWGMTEATCVATKFDYLEPDKTGSIGRPIPGVDMKLVDDDGNDISDFDARGELCLRGPTICRGYYENPEANARDWDKDGFFHTGDIGYCDKSSKLWYVVDRKKELIKVRSFQVAPAELEGVLLSHPDIVDAAVIGIPDPNNAGSELPRAYLVKHPDKNAPPNKEIDAMMREKLAAFKMLTGGIIYIEAIPKNASGKILKRLLREKASKERKDGGAKL